MGLCIHVKHVITSFLVSLLCYRSYCTETFLALYYRGKYISISPFLALPLLRGVTGVTETLLEALFFTLLRKWLICSSLSPLLCSYTGSQTYSYFSFISFFPTVLSLIGIGEQKVYFDFFKGPEHYNQEVLSHSFIYLPLLCMEEIVLICNIDLFCVIAMFNVTR